MIAILMASILINMAGLYINKLLVMEASRFAIKPILYAAACEIVWMSALIKIDESSWSEFIGYIPVEIFILFTILLIIIVVTAYLIGSYKIRKQNIVEAIKDETI